MSLKLGVNIDHIATLRNQRSEQYLDMLEIANLAIANGADSITAHLREDRRHIKDDDIILLKNNMSANLNLEMAATEEMINFATNIRPYSVCLVPEKRQELTTEGGLNIIDNIQLLTNMIQRLHNANILVSIFIDTHIDQIEAAKTINADIIEINTGVYANLYYHNNINHINQTKLQPELLNIQAAVDYANKIGLRVNAGHGLDYGNIKQIKIITGLYELNIGYAIVNKSIFIGWAKAVALMKVAIQ